MKDYLQRQLLSCQTLPHKSATEVVVKAKQIIDLLSGVVRQLERENDALRKELDNFRLTQTAGRK